MGKLRNYSTSLIDLGDMLKNSLRSKDAEFSNGDCQINLIDIMGDYLEWMRDLALQKRELESSRENSKPLTAVNK
ncbi:MAG TPA: hypothetical protein VGB26_10875 [Nitrospiria bacterium]|jgi:hypothetical protein